MNQLQVCVLALGIAAISTTLTSIASAQQSAANPNTNSIGVMIPLGGNGNVLRPGIPLTGPGSQPSGTVSVPAPTHGRTGVTGIASGTGRRGGGAAGGGGGGRNPEGQRGEGYYGGGPIFVPYPVSGYVDTLQGNGAVHYPPPGAYDPIFGVYNAGGTVGSAPIQPTPTVIINQNFQPDVVRPQLRDYSNVTLPPPGARAEEPRVTPVASSLPSSVPSSIDGDTPMFLIAMKDHTIYPALAYWVQGDTLNYVMVGGAVNHASISAVDRDLSAKLNSERNVEFRLPDGK